MKTLIFLTLFSIFISSSLSAQEKSKTGVVTTGEEMEIVGLGFEKKFVANAEIVKSTVILNPSHKELNDYEKNSELFKKSEFELILTSRIATNDKGEFVIIIQSKQFKQIPDNSTFDLKLKIKPPKDFVGIYSNDEVIISLKQKDGPQYKLILYWIPESTKSNKGTFAVSSKAQT